MVDLSAWPGTLWEREPDGTCKHCRRSYAYHGASENVTMKKGFRINQRQLLCRPPGDINPQSMTVGDGFMANIDALIGLTGHTAKKTADQ